MLVRSHDCYTDKWGYVEFGKTVIDRIYDKATEFQGEHALVLWRDKWQMIDKAGKEVALFCNKYSHMAFLSNGLIRVNSFDTEPEDVRKGVINYKEEIIVDCKYEYIGFYYEHRSKYVGSYPGFIIGNNVINREYEILEEEEYVNCEVESTLYTVAGEKLKGPDRIKTSVEWRSEHDSLSRVCDSNFINELVTSKAPKFIGNIIVYKPTDRLLNDKRAACYGALLSDIYKYIPGYISNAIKKYSDFAIDIVAFENLSPPTPIDNDEEFAEIVQVYDRMLQDIGELRFKELVGDNGRGQDGHIGFIKAIIKKSGYKPTVRPYRFPEDVKKFNEIKIKKASNLGE